MNEKSQVVALSFFSIALLLFSLYASMTPRYEIAQTLRLLGNFFLGEEEAVPSPVPVAQASVPVIPEPIASQTEILVKVKAGIHPATAAALGELRAEYTTGNARKVFPAHGATPLSNIYAVELKPGTNVEAVARAYGRNTSVLYAEPNYIRSIPGADELAAAAIVSAPGGTLGSRIGASGPTIGSGRPALEKETKCGDGIDNDGDGLIDGQDPDCAGPPPSGPPNDALYAQQWNLAKVSAEGAWDIEEGVPETVIAVIDSGVHWSHPDLAENIWVNPGESVNGIDDDGNGFIDDIRGWDFVGPGLPPYCSTGIGEDCGTEDNDPNDFYNHGTHVAGIAAAVTNNGIGVAGMCRNCRIMPVRAGYAGVPVGSVVGLFTDEDIIQAITYAADNGADIITMSFGGTAPSDVLADVIAYAVSKGVVPVAAAGNYDVWVPFYPAGYPDVISVASTDENDAKSFFSNYSSYSEHGELIDVAAPGEAIWSTAIPGSDLGCADTDGDGYSACSGTSMAAPLVSGALGLIRSHAASSLGQIKTLIHSFADPVVSTEYIARRPDAFMAVSKAPGIGQGVLENSCGYCGGGPISFTGSASGSGFQNYVIEYGTGVYPANWTVFKNSATPVANGTLGILDPVAQGLATGIYTIRLTVTASGSTMTDYAVLYIDADLAAGWPKQLVDGCVGCESFVAAAIADVNGDGDGEIFFTTVTEDTTPGTFVMHLHGIEHTGTPLPGFPIFLNTPYVNIPPLRSPAIADIDGDGTYEIVVGSSTGIGSAMVTSVHMFNANGTVQSGWPVTIGPIGGTQSTSRKAATLANLDGGNDLEIIFIEGKCIGGCNQETVHVYKSNGQPLAGWPQDIAAFGNDTVAVGDIDADGDQELVFGGGSTVYVYNADGTPYGSGWPKAAITSSGFDISLADIDGNDGGKLEVISQKWTTPTLYVHNHDGTSVFSKSLPNASIPPYIILEPVIGDLNGSSPLNIIARGRDKLYAFTNTGANVPGWPITGPDYTAIGVNSAVMIDLEGDGSREILFNGTRYTGVANPVDWGQLFGYRADGTVAPQFPKTVKQPFLLMSAGKVAPGGKVNLFVIDGGGTGYLWEWAGTASTDAFQWPTFRHDMLRTGLGPVPGSGGGSPPPPPTDTLPPSAPGTLNASPGSGQANLTWGAALDNVAIGGYRITAATKSSFASNFIHPAWNDTFVGNVLNFPVTGLLGGTTYYFRVRAEDTSGNLGPYSNIAEAAPF